MTALDLQKLAAAKLWLISPAPGPGRIDAPRDLAYLSHALYALIPVARDDVPTITCDEWWRIYVNPAWLVQASVPEVGAELAHLCWHLLSDHTERARDQGVDRSTLRSWNTAADAALARTLAVELVSPEGFPKPADFRARDGLSAEEYFAMLSGIPATHSFAGGDSDDNAIDADGFGEPGGCGSGADGIARSNELGPDRDIGAVTAFEAREIRRVVAIEFRDHALKRGRDAGDALRWAAGTLEPTVSWAPLLTGAVRRAIGWAAGRGTPTYSRPSRRASSVPNVVMPGQHRAVPRVSIIVDTSGSVDDRMLSRALGEVDAVIAALGVPGSHLTLYSVDAAVHTVTRLRSARDARLVGAGGTDLRIGLRAVESERPRPDVVIVFTDGGTPWPTSPPPGTAVIVARLAHEGAMTIPVPTWTSVIDCTVAP